MMLVPGPDGGPIDRWARLVQPALAQSVAPGAVFHQEIVGGADGVTAANQFGQEFGGIVPKTSD